MPPPQKPVKPAQTQAAKQQPWFRWPSFTFEEGYPDISRNEPPVNVSKIPGLDRMMMVSQPSQKQKEEWFNKQVTEHLKKVKPILESKNPKDIQAIGLEFPVAQNRFTRVPIFEVGDSYNHLARSRSRSIGGQVQPALRWSGAVPSLHLNRNAAELPTVLINRSRSDPDYKEVVAHEMIHASQALNPSLHDRARDSVRSEDPFRAVLGRVYGDENAETEAFVGSGGVYYNKGTAKAYSGNENFVSGQNNKSDTSSSWDRLISGISDFFSSETKYGPADFNKTRNDLTQSYPYWLKHILSNYVGPTK